MEERTEETKRRENIIVAIGLCGAIPLFVYSKIPWVWVLLKVYSVTVAGFGSILFIQEREARAKKWFWKAMLVVIPIHILCMAAFAYLNFRWITVPIRPMVSYFIVFIVFIIEFGCLSVLIDKFRPPADSTTPPTPPQP
jgi:hypothetical protein